MTTGSQYNCVIYFMAFRSSAFQALALKAPHLQESDENNPHTCRFHFFHWAISWSLMFWMSACESPFWSKWTKSLVKPPDLALIAQLGDNMGYPRYHKHSKLPKCPRWKGLNLLSFLWMVAELNKQKDIKPILCAPCVFWTRLVGPCLSAEDGPRCK